MSIGMYMPTFGLIALPLLVQIVKIWWSIFFDKKPQTVAEWSNVSLINSTQIKIFHSKAFFLLGFGCFSLGQFDCSPCALVLSRRNAHSLWFYFFNFSLLFKLELFLMVYFNKRYFILHSTRKKLRSLGQTLARLFLSQCHGERSIFAIPCQTQIVQLKQPIHPNAISKCHQIHNSHRIGHLFGRLLASQLLIRLFHRSLLCAHLHFRYSKRVEHVSNPFNH